LGSHKLEIESGRFHNIPRENRSCKLCQQGVVESENSLLSDGITVVETDPTGVIWLKLCKHFFQFEQDVYVCFSYIPPQNSAF